MTAKQKILFFTGALLLTCQGQLQAGNPDNGKQIKSSDAFLKPSEISVHGLLGDALLLTEQGRLKTLPEWNNGTLINMFSREARLKNTTTDWYGEHAGKWMYSAALSVKRTGNEDLKKALFQTADYLVSTQEADGYLGSYSPELRITNNASRFHKRSWDTWSLSYMILGFLEIDRQFQTTKYREAAKNIGELLLKTFGDGKNDITGYGTRYGYSATIALEPVVELYKLTSDKRYLQFAELIVKKVEQREGLRLIASMLNNRDLETVADGKAYQIIWNLLGLAKLYEITGNKDYIKAIENAWKNIADHHLTVTGGPWGGIGKHKECFNTKNYWAPYGYVETCSTMSWIQLNKMLLQLTGDSKYAEEVERSAYNALIGAQFANGQDWSYHIFSNGKKHVANYNDCCPSSGVLALQEIPAMVYSLRGNGIALNIFSASEASMIVNGQAIRISQQTQYPFDGKINLTISSQKTSAFPLYIRIPEWASGTSITIDGKPLEQQVVAGSYLTINHNWGKKNTIEILLPMELKLVEKAEHAVIPQGTDDIYRVNWFALRRGPLVYATNGLINGMDRERNFILPGKDASQVFKPVAAVPGFKGQAYQLTLPVEKPLIFLPYFEAGGRDSTGWRLTWLQQKID